MAAGVFGYMGYDTVRLIEHLPNERPDALGVPDGMLRAPDASWSSSTPSRTR